MRAVVIADGEHAPGDELQLRDADLVIAADGGAEWLAAASVVPNRLVGDLDSASGATVDRLAAAGVAIERHPTNKDASDLELAVRRAVLDGADPIVLIGALGGALDHLLANVLLLGASTVAGRAISIVHGDTTARLLVGPGRLVLHGPPGTRVSLLPVGDAAGVTTRGLHWPLDGARLAAGSSQGLANVVDTTPASVRLTAGRLLVIEIGGSAERTGRFEANGGQRREMANG